MFAEDNSLLLLVGADHRVASHRPKCGSSAPSSQLAKARGLARSSYERETPGHEQTLTHSICISPQVSATADIVPY